jgi:hypothetical protein
MGNRFDEVPLAVGVVADAALTGGGADVSDVTACGRAMPYALPWRETGTPDDCWLASAADGEAGDAPEAGPSASDAVMAGPSACDAVMAGTAIAARFSRPLPMALH